MLETGQTVKVKNSKIVGKIEEVRSFSNQDQVRIGRTWYEVRHIEPIEPKTLFVVGQMFLDDPLHQWEFMGVFDTREQAVAACKGEYCFVGPIELNREVSGEAIVWPGVYYPRA